MAAYIFTELWLDVNLDDYFITQSSGHGVQVVVHDPEDYPRVNERGIAISPGTEAFISIERNDVTRLPPPHSSVDCVKEDFMRDYKYKFDPTLGKYSYETCMLDCMLDVSLNACNCSYNHNAPGELCTLADYYACVYPKMRNYYPKCDCKYPCKQTWYESTLTSLAIPTPSMVNILSSFDYAYTTEEEIRRNMIVLHVYYPALQYRTTDQLEAFTIDELISNLGGQLGLFLGASLLTVVELVESVALMVGACYKRHRNKRQIQQISQTQLSVTN